MTIARHHVILTTEGELALKQYMESHPGMTMGEVVSVALRNLIVWENRDYAKEMIDRSIEQTLTRRVMKMENGLRSMMASMMIDVCMLLADVVEDRAMASGVSVAEDYESLRKAGLVLFNRKRLDTQKDTEE